MTYYKTLDECKEIDLHPIIVERNTALDDLYDRVLKHVGFRYLDEDGEWVTDEESVWKYLGWGATPYDVFLTDGHGHIVDYLEKFANEYRDIMVKYYEAYNALVWKPVEDKTKERIEREDEYYEELARQRKEEYENRERLAAEAQARLEKRLKREEERRKKEEEERKKYEEELDKLRAAMDKFTALGGDGQGGEGSQDGASESDRKSAQRQNEANKNYEEYYETFSEVLKIYDEIADALQPDSTEDIRNLATKALSLASNVM